MMAPGLVLSSSLEGRSKKQKSRFGNLWSAALEFPPQSGLNSHWSRIGCARSLETLTAPLFPRLTTPAGL